MRKILLTLHLYIGLAAAFFLLCVSLSGAVIAFEPELNRTFHSDLTNVAPSGPALSWDQVRARVDAQSPGWKLIRFYFPEQPDQSTYVRLRNVATHKIRHVYVSQYTGAILGSTEDGSNWIIKVHDLHVNFLSGKVGNTIVVTSTCALAVLSLSGIILWWPRRIFRFRISDTPMRVNRDLHMSLGFWTFVVMLGFSLTGLALHYQTGKLTDLMNTPRNAVSLPGHGTSIEGMLQAAREALPGAAIPRLLLPEKKGDPVFLYMRFPEDRTPAGRSFATLDPKTGAVLSVGSSRTAPLFQTALVQWTRELHTGTLLGLAGKILVALFALALAVLTITGPLMWWNKSRAAAKGRRVLRERASQRMPVAQEMDLIGKIR